MPENRIFAANRAGKIAHLLQFHHPSTELIELAAMAGMDGVDLDGECHVTVLFLQALDHLGFDQISARGRVGHGGQGLQDRLRVQLRHP